MFKNKNYVKSRFTVLATGVFLSTVITAPQSQAAFSINLTCSIKDNVAKVSKPTASAIANSPMEFRWWLDGRGFTGGGSFEYVNFDSGYGNFWTSIKNNYVQVFDPGVGKWSGRVACR